MYRHTLVAVHPSNREVSARLAEVARHLAGPETRVTLLSVVEPAPSYDANLVPQGTVDRLHAETREKLAENARATGMDAERVLGHGQCDHGRS